MRGLVLSSVLLSGALLASPSVSQELPFLLADVTPGAAPPLQARGFALGSDGRRYLAGCDRAQGCEAYVIDGKSGSVEGLRILRDAQPGPCSWAQESFSRCDAIGRHRPTVRIVATEGPTFVIQSAVYLIGAQEDVAAYSETANLYRTDPTGLRSLGDFVVNTEVEPVWFHGALYFSGAQPAPGNFAIRYSFWRSDGTSEGTFPVSGISPSSFKVAFDRLYLLATDAGWQALYRSDGTPQGTVRAEGRLDSSGVAHGISIRGRDDREVLVYSGRNAQSWPGLFRSDGTEAGTYIVSESPGAASLTSPHSFLAGTRRAFFVASGQLGVTDGTAPGTRYFAQVRPTAASRTRLDTGAVSGEVLFFAGTGDETSGEELWVSDGTDAGTHLVVDLAAGPLSSAPGQIVAFDGGVAFVARDAVGQIGVYRTDGTAAGTFPLILGAEDVSGLANLDGTLWFSRNDGIFVSRGTPATTTVAFPYSSGADSVLMNRQLLPGRMLLSLAAAKTVLSSRVLSTNGESTEMLSVPGMGPDVHLVPGAAFAETRSNKGDGPVSRALVSGLCDVPSQTCLGVTNGTSVGTRLLARGIEVSEGAPLGNGLLLACSACEGRLWITDGTPEGTRTTSIGSRLPPDVTAIRNLSAAGERILFVVSRGGPEELWSTDGTPEGTTLVQGAPAVSVNPLVRLGANSLFTVLRPDGTGWGHSSILATDGRAGGETLLIDEHLTLLDVADDIALLGTPPRSNQARSGPRLFRTDGTARGTYSVFQGLAGIPRSGRRVPGGFLVTVDQVPIVMPNIDPPLAFPVRQDLYFVADTTDARAELLLRDAGMLRGLVNGRALLVHPSELDIWNLGVSLGVDISAFDLATRQIEVLGRFTNFGEGFPTFQAHGSRALFAAADAEHGIELWRTDGTARGTFRVTDLAPGAASSMPTLPVFLGSTAIFMATDGASGLEPWALPSLAFE